MYYRDDPPEGDWKYMREVRPDLLSELCSRINRRSRKILDSKKPEHEKYIALFRHIEASDHIVAKCFNDWRRSTFYVRMLALEKQKLLTDDHRQHLSKECRERLGFLRETC